MSKRLLLMLRRINNFLFGQEEQLSKHEESNIPRYNQTITARVIHQYPKQGKFRFPVVEDKYDFKKVLDGDSKQKVNVEKKETEQVFPSNRPMFGGANFKATTVPSPVHGYKKPKVDNGNVFQEDHLVSLIEDTRENHRFEPIDPTLFFTKEEMNQTVNTNEALSVSLQQEYKENKSIERTQKENDVNSVESETEVVVEEEVVVAPHTEQEFKNETNVLANNNHLHQVKPYNVIMFQTDRKALQKRKGEYQYPQLQLLNIPPKKTLENNHWLLEKKQLLEITLANFNVQAKVTGMTKGPSVTRFEIQPEPGVKVSKVTSLTDDIKLSLAANDIRIEAPIPGKNAIGIEVPNDVSEPVVIREVLRSPEFQKTSSPLTVAMGLDISGQSIVTDLQKMPHGLIAGATGSGKSVCINSILISLMFKASPDEVKLMLIDPKMVELTPYNDIPHLVTPVITDAKQATVALKWAVEEMERRYELFVQAGVRDIKKYNEIHKSEDDSEVAMPYLVIIIDELADLMMVAAHDVEEAICRIAQKARACGIHLLVATQRPSVDVITGLIKANIPTRIAFSVSSHADSRTIIDSGGAERLLGKGDMLLYENGSSKPLRVQGNYVSDEEIDRVIELVKSQRKPNYLFDKEQLIRHADVFSEQEDELFEEACYFVIEQGGASSSSLQRKFRIGFKRAARLIDMMEAMGFISEAMGSKPRNILINEAELEGIFTG